jgi:hypothetical protein
LHTNLFWPICSATQLKLHDFRDGSQRATLEAPFLIAALCRLGKPLSHSGQMGWLVGAVGIERTSYRIRLVPSMRCSHRRSPTGTNGTSVNCVRLRSRRNCAEIRMATERLPSNKEGKNSKCFAERRLRTLSPEISPSVVPKLYRTLILDEDCSRRV